MRFHRRDVLPVISEGFACAPIAFCFMSNDSNGVNQRHLRKRWQMDYSASRLKAFVKHS